MAAIDRLLDEAIERGVAPGIVASVLIPDGQILSHVAGVRSGSSPQPMTADTLFWIASCTKAMTAVAALQLVERGILRLDEPVSRWLPELAAPQVLRGFTPDGVPVLSRAQSPITLRHLLTHLSGFAYDFCSADLHRYLEHTGQAFTEVNLAELPLMFDPGAAWQYGPGPEWAGRLVEVASGMDLADYMRDHIFVPLGMHDTFFKPSAEQGNRLAGVHARLEDGRFLPNLVLPDTPDIFRGGSGLFTTAHDYLVFLRMVLGKGQQGGARILDPSSIALLTRNQIGDLPAGELISASPTMTHDFLPMPGIEKGWSLGFLVNSEAVPDRRSAGSLAWAGIANCYYWADPVKNVAGVLFTQVMPFADPEILSTFGEFERQVYQQQMKGGQG